MVAAVRAVAGGRARSARRLVSVVLRAYPRAPVDRPRELCRFLTTLSPARAVIRRRLVAPARVVRMRWGAPGIGDLAELAAWLGLDGDALDWLADRREINRHARAEPLRHYRYTWLPHRLIEAPKPRMRAL